MGEGQEKMKILFLNTVIFSNLNEFLLGKILIIIPESFFKTTEDEATKICNVKCDDVALIESM